MSSTAPDRVLLVDDEPHILAALERGLRGKFAIEKTDKPQRAIELLTADSDYAVIVSDMCMPVVDGATLLSRARVLAPDTTRVMLTGNADQMTAARAVNEGSVFRFLNKPCSTAELAQVLDAAIEHHRRLRAERELLEQTLQGAVEVLTDVLGLVDPKAFGNSKLLRDQAGWIARKLGLERVWEIELAALMSQLGRIAVPPEVRAKEEHGGTLSAEEQAMLARVPQVAAGLIVRIPRLDGVAQILTRIDSPCLDVSAPVNGSALLATLLRLSQIHEEERSRQKALARLRTERKHDPRVVAAIAAWVGSNPDLDSEENAQFRLQFSELRIGMVTAAPIETSDGRVLLGADQLVTSILFERICNHARLSGVREPLLIHRKSGKSVSDEKDAS